MRFSIENPQKVEHLAMIVGLNTLLSTIYNIFIDQEINEQPNEHEFG